MSTTYKTHVLYRSSHNLSVVTCLLWWQHNNSPVSHTHQPQLPVSSQQITDYYSLNTLAWELVFTIHCCLILRHQRPVWLCSGLKTIINDNWLKTDNQTKHVSDLTDELFKILLQYEQWWTMINLLWQCHVKHQKEVNLEKYFKSEPTSDSLVTLTVLYLMSDLTCWSWRCSLVESCLMTDCSNRSQLRATTSQHPNTGCSSLQGENMKMWGWDNTALVAIVRFYYEQ